MSAFQFVRRVKASRKSCRCGQCLRLIEVGTSKVVLSGNWDGDFYTTAEHPECHAAAEAYYRSSYWPDAEVRPVLINDIDVTEDGSWLRENYPAVAKRMGLLPTPT